MVSPDASCTYPPLPDMNRPDRHSPTTPAPRPVIRNESSTMNSKSSSANACHSPLELPAWRLLFSGHEMLSLVDTYRSQDARTCEPVPASARHLGKSYE